MSLHPAPTDLPWLQPGDALPCPSQAWGPGTPAPGLLAAGQDIGAQRLVEAYRQGIFPWYSHGQPVLWWSPDPRMVLRPQAFRLHRSLHQSLRRFLSDPDVHLVFDHGFEQVMRSCAQQARPGQSGTWIVEEIIEAYTDLHRQGLAHSAELWRGDELLAGLYFVAMGRAVFGESMFTRVTDGSKIALCLLVSVAQQHGVHMIDCQQKTAHLASLGASEIPRSDFLQAITTALDEPAIDWAQQRLDLSVLLPSANGVLDVQRW